MFTTPGGSSASWITSAEQERRERGRLRRLQHGTCCRPRAPGASFHDAISSGKFHGITWPATPIGRGVDVREGVLELVGPPGVVEEVRRGERKVDVARLLDRLAAVHRLQDGELARALLELPRDPEQVLRALGAGQVAPGRRRTPRARRRPPRRRPRRPASATSANASSVAGLIVGNHRPLFGSTNSPPMKRP